MAVIEDLSKTFNHYRSRIKKSQKTLQYAKQTSMEEVVFNLQKIAQFKNKKDILKAILTITNSSIWVSRSAFSVLRSYFDISSLENIDLNSEKSQEILACVANKRKVDASNIEIFKTIYHEITQSHLIQNYSTPLVVPQTNVTIVLVSGVFNEIFSTPAFKRGAESLLNQYNIKHFAPTVDGRKGAKENALRLKKQVTKYLKDHPEERLWFFCFSKGGIDTLHYLKLEGEKIANQIVGVSLIATPILGSDHLNSRILKLANRLAQLPEQIGTTILQKKLDIRVQDLQKSLSKQFREGWFKRNHNYLPKHLFYTSLAFESEWHNSHVWMMLTKAIFQSSKINDGVVDVENAQFPFYFNGINLGILKGHHLVGSRSSFYDQEALMMAHLIFLNYKNYF